jgi:hypothetical protein
LDRNLGAAQVPTSVSDANGYGDLFQWGRLADGHQLRTSTTTATLSSTDVPGNAFFITTNGGNFDWRSSSNDNLWQGVNGTNNVCPTGFRIPTVAEFEAQRGIFGGNNGIRAYASPLKLPWAGLRLSDGVIYSEGSQGFYWTSNFVGTNSTTEYFQSGSLGELNYGRATGASVRCIRN